MFPRGHGAGVALLRGQCFGAPSCMFVTPRGSGRGRSSQGFGLRPPSCDHPAHCHRGRTSLRRSCWDVAGAARLPLRQRDIPTMRTPSEPDLRPSGPLTQRPIGSPPVGPAPGQQPPLPHSSDCLGLDIEVDEGPSLWPDLTSSPRLHWVLSLWNVGGLGSLVTMRKMAVTAWQSMLTAHPSLVCGWSRPTPQPAPIPLTPGLGCGQGRSPPAGLCGFCCLSPSAALSSAGAKASAASPRPQAGACPSSSRAASLALTPSPALGPGIS